jgi:hypothetical protein
LTIGLIAPRAGRLGMGAQLFDTKQGRYEVTNTFRPPNASSLYLSNIPAAKLSSINLPIASPDREAKNRQRPMCDSVPLEIGKT